MRQEGRKEAGRDGGISWGKHDSLVGAMLSTKNVQFAQAYLLTDGGKSETGG